MDKANPAAIGDLSWEAQMHNVAAPKLKTGLSSLPLSTSYLFSSSVIFYLFFSKENYINFLNYTNLIF